MFQTDHSENSWKLLKLKVENRVRVFGLKLSKQTKKAYVHDFNLITRLFHII